jgi:hypothetical protein
MFVTRRFLPYQAGGWPDADPQEELAQVGRLGPGLAAFPRALNGNVTVRKQFRPEAPDQPSSHEREPNELWLAGCPGDLFGDRRSPSPFRAVFTAREEVSYNPLIGCYDEVTRARPATTPV